MEARVEEDLLIVAMFVTVMLGNVEVAILPYQVEVAREPVKRLAESEVKAPVPGVEAPIVTPLKVDVVTFPYQVDVAIEPVKRLAESVVKLPAAGVDPPIIIPFKVVVAFSI